MPTVNVHSSTLSSIHSLSNQTLQGAWALGDLPGKLYRGHGHWETYQANFTEGMGIGRLTRQTLQRARALGDLPGKLYRGHGLWETYQANVTEGTGIGRLTGQTLQRVRALGDLPGKLYRGHGHWETYRVISAGRCVEIRSNPLVAHARVWRKGAGKKCSLECDVSVLL